ncbi:MAG: ATP-binding cassette domain-containing protein [Pseudomonadota bacterium]
MTAELAGVTVERGGHAILKDAHVSCPPGAFTALCGPNGAGKTTALSVMTGALIPDAGTARLEGANLSDIHRLALARRRAVVSQSSQLGFPFQVHEVVAMGRAPHHGHAAPLRDDAIIAEALEAMDLMTLAERDYLSLSGGERQRADIARALAQVWDPPAEGGARWLFLDEPTAALDLKYQIALMQRLKALAGEGWGIVAILHDLQLIKEYADTVIIFKLAEVVASGMPSEMLTGDRIQSVFDLEAPYTLV